MKQKLKPCPFCGSQVKLDKYDFYMFCCDNCGAGITFAKVLDDGTAEDCNKRESVQKWNNRSFSVCVEQNGENCNSIANTGTININMR